MNGIRTDDGIDGRDLVVKHLENVGLDKAPIRDVVQLRSRDSFHAFRQVNADKSATSRDPYRKVSGSGAEFEQSRTGSDASVLRYPFKNLVMRGTDWISLAPHFRVVGVGFIIVIESVGVCAPHISIFTTQLKIKPIKRKIRPQRAEKSTGNRFEESRNLART